MFLPLLMIFKRPLWLVDHPWSASDHMNWTNDFYGIWYIIHWIHVSEWVDFYTQWLHERRPKIQASGWMHIHACPFRPYAPPLSVCLLIQSSSSDVPKFSIWFLGVSRMLCPPAWSWGIPYSESLFFSCAFFLMRDVCWSYNWVWISIILNF